MLHQYLPVLVFGALGILVGAAFATLNMLLGPKRVKGDESSAAIRQMDPYECGLPSEISSTFRFGVSFYLIAMLFILFDIEVVFMYPWASVLRQLRDGYSAWLALLPMGFFLLVLIVGLIYEWKKGALDWE